MRSRLRSASGFTLIEVMVAALILVIAFSAFGAVVISGQSQASSDVQQSQLINVADQELEQVRAAVATAGFTALGMSATPHQLSTRTVRSTFFDPDSFVVAGTGTSCLLVATNYDSVTTTAPSGTPAYGVTAPSGFTPFSACGATSAAEPLAVLSGTSPAPIVTWSASTVPKCATGGNGSIAVPCWTPLTSSCSSTAVSVTAVPSCAATVYAFVTNTFVGCGASASGCPATSSGVLQCPSTSLATTSTASTVCSDARRVIIAVVPNPPSQTTPTATHQLSRVTPVYLSTIFTNPVSSASSAGSAGLTLNLNVL